MNAKTIEGLKVIRKGIDLILEGATETENAPIKSGIKNEKENVKEAKEPVANSSVDKTDKGAPISDVTREQLDGMTYNDLKKLAKSMGIPAVGNRDDITNKILGENVESDTDIAQPVSKKSKKTEEAPEEVPVDDSDNDPIYAQVVEAVADMDNEEIADLLVEVGLSARGKREALIDKVVQAVRDGLIEFDDDYEEDTDEDDTADEAPAKKPEPAEEPEEDEEEEDNTNDIDNPNMTKARKKAILAQDDDIRKQWKKGKVTRDDLVEFLQTFYDTEDDMSDMSDDDLLDTYIDAVCRLVDDDGNLVDEGAYMLNGEPACCGRVLAYSEDTNVFICEHCGEEYEADE